MGESCSWASSIAHSINLAPSPDCVQMVHPDYSFAGRRCWIERIARSVTILVRAFVIGGQFFAIQRKGSWWHRGSRSKSGPRVSTVSPGTGPIASGTAVTLSGSGFQF